MAPMLIAELPGLNVTLRELSVAEVRAWVAEQEAGAPVDPLRCMVLEDCSVDDLARMSDATAEQLEAYGPSGLGEVRDKAKALNPHFFRVREALTSVSRAIQAQLASSSSTDASPPLPVAGM